MHFKPTPATKGAEEMILDKEFLEALKCFLTTGRASTSLLERRLRLSYARSAKICDQMESLGIVGPDQGTRGRRLLVALGKD